MSKFLEDRIFRRLEIAYEEEAEKSGIPIADVEKCPPLILRQVSCLDKAHQVRAELTIGPLYLLLTWFSCLQVREGVLERYKDKGYPSEFPCRTKCILLFQTIDGQVGLCIYTIHHTVCWFQNYRFIFFLSCT